MNDQPPLNPDALTSSPELFMVASTHHFHGDECLCGFKSARSRDRTEHIMLHTLAAAQPVASTMFDLLDTRAGLALANTAFQEGLGVGIRACNKAVDGEPFVKPVSPYSAPLLAMIKADQQEAKDD